MISPENLFSRLDPTTSQKATRTLATELGVSYLNPDFSPGENPFEQLVYANTVYLSPHTLPAPLKTQGETLFEAIARIKKSKPGTNLVYTAAEAIQQYPGWVSIRDEDFWRQSSPYLKLTGYNDDSNCITRAAILVEYLIAAGVPEESITTIAPFSHLYIQVKEPQTEQIHFVDFLTDRCRVVSTHTRNGALMDEADLPTTIIGLIRQNMLPDYSFPARLGVALVQLRAFGEAEEFLQLQEDIKPLQKRILGSV